MSRRDLWKLIGCYVATEIFQIHEQWKGHPRPKGPVAYDLMGYVSVSSDSPNVYGASLFRDELYFQTDNGEPGEIVFNFYLDLSIDESSVDPEFHVSLSSPKDSEGNEFFYLEEREFLASISEEISISTLGDGSGFVESDTYLPISISTAAAVYGGTGIIDWGNTFLLRSVDVYQWENDQRILLDPRNYTLMSSDLAKAIPEPSTFALMVLGLFGIGYKRSRSKTSA